MTIHNPPANGTPVPIDLASFPRPKRAARRPVEVEVTPRQPEPEPDARKGLGSMYPVEEIGARFAALPRYWGTVINGDCMTPDYNHGEIIIVDKEAWPATGDIAVMYLETVVDGRPVAQALIKRVLMGMWKMKLPCSVHEGNQCIPLLSFGSNRPGEAWTVQGTKVHGLFKVIGRYDDFQLIGDTLVAKKKAPRRRSVSSGKAGRKGGTRG